MWLEDQQVGQPPEIHVVTMKNEELSSDVLTVAGYEGCMARNYRLGASGRGTPARSRRRIDSHHANVPPPHSGPPRFQSTRWRTILATS